MRKALRLVLTRGRGDQPLELALEVGLIRKAAGQGDLGQGLPLFEQGAGVADAPVQQIGVGVMP